MSLDKYFPRRSQLAVQLYNIINIPLLFSINIIHSNIHSSKFERRFTHNTKFKY